MKAFFTWGVILLTAMLFIKCSKMNEYDTQPFKLDTTEARFLMDAGYCNLNAADVDALASSKALNGSVRMFGEAMLQNDTSAQSELRSIASSVELSLPTKPDSLHSLFRQSLLNRSGAAFDSAYLSGQAVDLRTASRLFESELTNGKDSALKRYARKYLPKMQMHLAIADSLRTTL